VSDRNTSRDILHSTGAATFSQVWRMAVIFATHVLLRRLVEPGPWGIWHWSEPLFLLLGQIRDLGMPGHVMRIEPRPYGNLLRFEVIWGTVTAAGVVVAAPFLALGFSGAHDTDLVPVLRALALFLLFEGLAKVPLTFFEAELAIGRSVLPEVLRNVTFSLISITLAVYGYGVWCFIVAHVAGAFVFAAVLWWRAWGRIPLRLIPGVDRELLARGLPLMVMSILVLLTGKVDPLVLARRFDEATVGRYGLALFLAFLLAMMVALPVTRALYPALARLRPDPHRFFEAYRLATLLILTLEVSFALGLYWNAELALVLFGGEQYRQAAPYLQVLCFAPLCQPFSRCAGDVLLVRHQDRVLLISSLLTLLSLVGLGYYLTGVLGPSGMAWVNLLPLGSVLVTWAIYRVDPAGFRGLLRDLLLVYLVPVPLFFIAAAITDHPWLRLALSAVAAAAAVGFCAWRFRHDFRRFFRVAEL